MGIKFAGLVLNGAFGGGDGAPTMDNRPSARTVPVSLVIGRTRLSFNSSVVQASPLASVVNIAQPSAESSSVAAKPPCTVPIGL